MQSGRRYDLERPVIRGEALAFAHPDTFSVYGSRSTPASFFDATLDGSNFESADLTLANVEMAQFNRANLRNAIVREMYVSGSTLFEGVKDIENSDWSDTFLRKDQQKYLCEHPTAKGTNPVTGVDTRQSLMCKD